MTTRTSSTGRMVFSTAPTPSSSFGTALRSTIESELSRTSTTWRGTSTLWEIGSTEVTFAAASARVTAKSPAVNPSTGSCFAFRTLTKALPSARLRSIVTLASGRVVRICTGGSAARAVPAAAAATRRMDRRLISIVLFPFPGKAEAKPRLRFSNYVVKA